MPTRIPHVKNGPIISGSFIMLFLAVFCGFLAEYQLEHMIEHQREKQYANTLYEDLKTDTAILRSNHSSQSTMLLKG